jgi:DNA-binding NarL/FixJ family response regulator
VNPPVKDGREAIRVVIAEDQGMVLGALAALLEIEGDIAVIGKARNGKEALNAVLAQKPDIFITDIEMPGMTGLAAEAWVKADPLTDRERQVLRLAGDGLASGDIASQLGLSEGTVRNYLSEAISKLGAGNRVEAARVARTKGWL